MVDQITKALLRVAVPLYDTRPIVDGMLDFVHVRNEGVAFGLLNSLDLQNKWMLTTALASAALAGIAYYARHIRPDEKLARIGLSMILGGAIGNLIDRVYAGYVLDFIDVYWGDVALLGLQCGRRVDFDRRGARLRRSAPGETACIQSCLRSATGRSTPTACCWRPRICRACSSPWYARGALAWTARAVMDLGIYLIIAALVGAKLMLVAVDFDYFRSQPREMLSLVRAGGVFYGGLILSTIVGLLLVRRYKLPVWGVADVYAPGIALGHVIGRLGCLMAGCCYGRPTDVPWGITFTSPAAAANAGTPLGEPLHPTQLYDAGAELLILVFLLVFERRGKRFAGRTFWLYMLLYAISRFIVEIYRGDNRGTMAGMSTSQFVSLLVVPTAIVMLLRLRRAPGTR